MTASDKTTLNQRWALILATVTIIVGALGVFGGRMLWEKVRQVDNHEMRISAVEIRQEATLHTLNQLDETIETLNVASARLTVTAARLEERLEAMR